MPFKLFGGVLSRGFSGNGTYNNKGVTSNTPATKSYNIPGFGPVTFPKVKPGQYYPGFDKIRNRPIKESTHWKDGTPIVTDENGLPVK